MTAERKDGLVCRFERFDFQASQLARPETTQDGYWKLEGKVARTGIQIYRDSDGNERRELRLEGEVKKSLPGFTLSPLTNGHPPGLVSPENAKQHIAGAVGPAEYADGWVKAPITVWTKDAIDAIRAGRAQLSVGYTCRLVHEPGVHDGQKFDSMQTDIQVNHVALVDQARAGSQARLRLDAGDAATEDFFASDETVVVSDATTASHTETTRMLIMKIDSLDVKVESANDQAIIEKAIGKARADGEEKLAAEKLRADAAETAKAATEKKLVEQQAKIDTLEEASKRDVKCDECSGSGKMDDKACSFCKGEGKTKADVALDEAQRAASRARCDARAARVAGRALAKVLVVARERLSANEKLDELSVIEIQKKILNKFGVKLDGKSDDYVAARYDEEMERRAETEPKPIDKVRLVQDDDLPPVTGDRSDEGLSPKEKMHRINEAMYFKNGK